MIACNRKGGGSASGRWLVFLGACQFLSPAVHSADIAMGELIPGAGVIRKPVVSLREARFRNLIPQSTDFSCGAAALATLLTYAYGYDASERAVMEGLLKSSDQEIAQERGFSLLDMKTYLETLGMRGRGYQVSLDKLSLMKMPAIVLLDIQGYQHFVVLKKVVDDQAYLGDPALGNKIVPVEQFAQGWNGVVFAVLGEGYEPDTPLRAHLEPLNAKQLLAVHGMVPLHNLIPDTQPLDYGFSSADLLRF